MKTFTMNYFLAKTDPETYSLDQFEKELIRMDRLVTVRTASTPTRASAELLPRCSGCFAVLLGFCEPVPS